MELSSRGGEFFIDFLANKFVYFYICNMKTENLIKAYKGIPPGKVIAQQIKKRQISQRGLAKNIEEHNQTLNAVIKGRRSMTVEMAVKLDNYFGFDSGFLYMLQSSYDVEQHLNKIASKSVSGVPNVRRILFWDIDFDKINWGLRRKFVISRVLERGSEEEVHEIARFYNLRVEELEQFRNHNTYKMKI